MTRRICTLIGSADSGWNSTHVLLPSGVHVLIWDALLDAPRSSRVLIDNVTLLDENCTALHQPGPPDSFSVQIAQVSGVSKSTRSLQSSFPAYMLRFLLLNSQVLFDLRDADHRLVQIQNIM